MRPRSTAPRVQLYTAGDGPSRPCKYLRADRAPRSTQSSYIARGSVRKLHFRRHKRRPLLAAGRCIHRLPYQIYRGIDTRTFPPTRSEHLPAPSRRRHPPHVARRGSLSMCECATIIWNSAITPPTDRRTASECVRRAVIIIISRLVIVIRGDDDTRCHRQINALRDCAQRFVVFDATIVTIVEGQGIVSFVLCIPTCWIVLISDCYVAPRLRRGVLSGTYVM